MGAFISKQPNGLYCRFSSIVDCPTVYNMTEEEYIEMCAEEARDTAKYTLRNYLEPFDRVIEDFHPTNMTQDAFEEFLKTVGYKQKGELK